MNGNVNVLMYNTERQGLRIANTSKANIPQTIIQPSSCGTSYMIMGAQMDFNSGRRIHLYECLLHSRAKTSNTLKETRQETVETLHAETIQPFLV
ncbi:Uncharacterized protein HZ326_22246 [Fusarium oxysporum f. sp. albedinis]|nr:Uncharacterized protein HZ326_22246 [Fusarium oxysporum f. sp. albedinis]